MQLKVHKNYSTTMWLLHNIFSVCSRNVRYLRGYQECQVFSIKTLICHRVQDFHNCKTNLGKYEVVKYISYYLYLPFGFALKYTLQIYFAPFPLKPFGS